MMKSQRTFLFRHNRIHHQSVFQSVLDTTAYIINQCLTQSHTSSISVRHNCIHHQLETSPISQSWKYILCSRRIEYQSIPLLKDIVRKKTHGYLHTPFHKVFRVNQLLVILLIYAPGCSRMRRYPCVFEEFFLTMSLSSGMLWRSVSLGKLR